MKLINIILILLLSILIILNIYKNNEHFIVINKNGVKPKDNKKKIFLIANNKKITREKLMNFLEDNPNYTYIFFNHIEPFKYLNDNDLQKIDNLSCKKMIFMRENHLNSYWGELEFKKQKVKLFNNKNSFVLSTQNKNNNKLNNPLNLKMIYYQDFINYNEERIPQNKFKLLYYLPAIGNPNLNIKLDILNHNLNYLYNSINFSFDVSINCYEMDDNICDLIYNNVKKLKFIDNIYFYKKKGMLTELFLTNPYNKFVVNYDYVLFIFDDIKIKNIDLFNMIFLKNKYNIRILSPKVLNSTHNFMHKYNDITINNFLEIYCILLNDKDFKKFLSLHTLKNKYMWGVDHLFGYYEIKTGIINDYIVDHKIPTKSPRDEANKKMIEYIKENTSFNSFSDIYKKYKPIKNNIITYPGKMEPQTGFISYHILKNKYPNSDVILWGFNRKKGEDPGDHLHEKNYELEYYKKNNITNIPL